jgi:FlaA1/EpsC-like NDP-sugar epimerase
MGRSVKIVDLARHMIELSGLTPEEDIKIEFTGIRPGENFTKRSLIKGKPRAYVPRQDIPLRVQPCRPVHNA